MDTSLGIPSTPDAVNPGLGLEGAGAELLTFISAVSPCSILAILAVFAGKSHSSHHSRRSGSSRGTRWALGARQAADQLRGPLLEVSASEGTEQWVSSTGEGTGQEHPGNHGGHLWEARERWQEGDRPQEGLRLCPLALGGAVLSWGTPWMSCTHGGAALTVKCSAPRGQPPERMKGRQAWEELCGWREMLPSFMTVCGMCGRSQGLKDVGV